MSTAARNKQRVAQQKIAAQRQAAQRAQRRTRILITGGSIAAVLAIVISLVLVKTLSPSPAAQAGPAAGVALPAGVAADVTSVPASTLTTVGSGTTFPQTVAQAAGPPLTSAAKPEVLYIGAGYCPYCATERWPLAVALSHHRTMPYRRSVIAAPGHTQPLLGS